MKRRFQILMFATAFILSAGSETIFPQTQPKYADNIIVVTMDGMRWQEVFSGMSGYSRRLTIRRIPKLLR